MLTMPATFGRNTRTEQKEAGEKYAPNSSKMVKFVATFSWDNGVTHVQSTWTMVLLNL